jgi:PHD/YefM family antitoxin component YafN of YafNO toxin-antitoxin module
MWELYCYGLGDAALPLRVIRGLGFSVRFGRLNVERSWSNTMDTMKFLRIVVLLAYVAGLSVRADFESNLLKELHGVGFKLHPMVVRSKIFELEAEVLKQHALEKLKEMNVRVLTDSESKVLPGEPFLELAVNIAQAQGPSHIYSVSLELRERAELERPKESVVIMAVSTWNRESLGIANRQEAVMQAIDRLLRVFAEELHGANGG